MHGFEYYPAATTVTIMPDETARVTLALHRMVDLRSAGWHSGSNHVHMNYGGNLHNTPENLLDMAGAEDLDVIVELIANKDNRILDYQFFSGAPHPLSNDQRVLYFNEEYRPPFYGHISLINLKEHLISPFTTGYEGTAIESLYPSNTDVFKLARRQGALGAYVHPFSGSSDPLEGNLGSAKAFPVDLALGVLDYHELASGANWATYGVWHHALNCGFQLPAVGGEDSISNLHNTAVVGQMRAYAHMNTLSWDNWIDAIRHGRLFVTSGPLLQLAVNDQMPGATIQLPTEGGNLKVKGVIQSIVPLDTAELVLNGQRISLGDLSAHRDPKGPGTHFAFERELAVTGSSWITLQASAGGRIHPIDDAFPQATTNPVWMAVGNRPVRSAASARYFIRWIDKLTPMAAEHPGWRSEQERTHVLAQFREARAVYERLLQEAEDLSAP
jgi:hypothetical protein